MQLEPSPNAVSLDRGAAHFRERLLATTDIQSNTPEENAVDGIVPATSNVLAVRGTQKLIRVEADPKVPRSKSKFHLSLCSHFY